MHTNYLSLTDAAFLYQETENVPMSIASVQIVELPHGVSETDFIAGFRQVLVERLPLVPYLTQRLCSPVGLIDQPRWETATNFDINRHVYTVDVPAPGAQADIERTVARLHTTPLDREHPLWDYAILRGLPNNRLAYYARIHHACADGMAAQVATQQIHSTDPATSYPTGDTTATQALFSSASPTDPFAAWLETLERFSQSSIDQAMASVKTAASVEKILQRAADPNQSLGALVQVPPPTPFNKPVDAKRSFAMGELPLRDLRGMAKATSSTINDVFLAVCSGALQRYLRRTGDLPPTPLIAGCPVSLRKPGQKDMKNRVSMMKVDLATHLADARTRLAHITESTQIGKAVMQDFADVLIDDLSLPGLPLMLQGLAAMNENAGGLPQNNLPINLVISNVPGPRKDLYSNGGKLLTHYPVSIATHGAGLNITVQSYAGVLYFSLTGCAKALPEPQQLRDDLLAAFSELCDELPSSVTKLKPAGTSHQEPVKPDHEDVEATPRVA